MGASEADPPESDWHERLSARLDLALSVLALVMLVLLVIELGDLAPGEWRPRVIQASTAIWVIFVAAFFFELALAPSKAAYLRGHWLSALSLAIPFLRIFRVARAVRVLRAGRVLRGLTLGRSAAALNRARKVLVSFAVVSQLVYVIALAVAVTATAAAVAFALERGAADSDLRTFPQALWWAVTVVTAGGGATEASTFEGRLVSLFLRVFGVGVVGYLTARIAVFFLGHEGARASEDAPASEVETRRAEDDRLAALERFHREEREGLRVLRDEVRALRADLQPFAEREPRDDPQGRPTLIKRPSRRA